MAWARTRQYGLMERWRNRLIQQPYQFQQMNDGYANYSPNVWVQSERNELALTLKNEVDQFNFWAGFSPFPMYFEEVVYFNDNRYWYNQPLRVSKSSYLKEFGQESLELLSSESVSYSGNQATISATLSEVENGELVVIFKNEEFTDSLDKLNYRIFDLDISYVGNTYIIKGHKSLFVKPSKQLEIDSFIGGNPQNRNELDINDATNFVDEVNIYRKYTNTRTQAQLLSIDYANNTVDETNVTPILTNGRFGEFYLSTDNTDFKNIPYGVKVWYKAGYDLQDNGNVFSPFESIIIRRAKVNFPVSVEEVAYRVSANWRDDAMKISESDAPGIYMNPIGDRMIDYYTWQTYQIYHDIEYGNAARFLNG